MTNAKSETANSDQSLWGLGKALFTDTALIATASIYVYAAVFTYQDGFTRVYGIPSELIVVDIASMLISAAALIPLAWMLVAVSQAVWKVVPKSQHPIAIEIRALIILETLFGMITLLGDLGLSGFLVLQVIAIILNLNVIILLFHGSKFIEKLREHQNAVDSHGWMQAGPKRAVLSLIIVAGVLLLLIHFYAVGLAKRQVEYFVLADSSNMAVLRIYGQSFVAAEFDPCTRELIGPVTVLGGDYKTTIRVVRANIGPLIARKPLSILTEHGY